MAAVNPLAVMCAFPDTTKTIAFPLDADGSSFVYFGDPSAENISDAASQDENLQFADVLSTAQFEDFDVAKLGGTVVLTPFAVVSISSKQAMPALWPSRTNAGSAVFLNSLGGVRTMVVMSHPALKKASCDALTGGAVLRNAVRTGLEDPGVERVEYRGYLKLAILAYTSKDRPNIRVWIDGGILRTELCDDLSRRDLPPPISASVELELSQASVLTFGLGAERAVLDIAGGCRARDDIGWRRTASPGDGTELDLGPLLSSLPSQWPPASGCASPECHYFVALVWHCDRISALVSTGGVLRHIVLDNLPAKSDFALSAAAYRRVILTSGRSAVIPGVVGTSDDDPNQYQIKLFAYAHRHGSRPGPALEPDRKAVMWTALLGPVEAAGLLDAEAADPVHRRMLEMREGVGVDEDVPERGVPSGRAGRARPVVPGTLGAFFSAARSCANRAIVLTQEMVDAFDRRLPPVRLGVTERIRIVAPKQLQLEDADVTIPTWGETPAGRAVAAVDNAPVSSSSVLLHCLGRLDGPRPDELPYEERLLSRVADVPLSAIVTCLRAMAGEDPRVVEAPPPSIASVVVRQVDVDMFEAIVQGTTSTSVVSMGLRGASLVFKKLHAAGGDAASAMETEPPADDGSEVGEMLHDVALQRTLLE